MSAQTAEGSVMVGFRTHNPDVLTCIANLSSDEVFTPPELAKQMLDVLEGRWAEDHDGASIWSDPTITFLDPVTKSGVFLREITRRLTAGLESVIPNLGDRVEHILSKQVFGVGITNLTALLARRSLYCSKDATGRHSIVNSFDRDWGNVWFEQTDHTWAGERCAYCGAKRQVYDRDVSSETHAYAFIHATDIRKRLAQMFGTDMQFDVIIGNPPYQLTDEAVAAPSSRVASASPVYDKFVDQAKRLNPRYLSMVIPARWMAGGRGLEAFRDAMLGDRHISDLVDYPDSSDVFGAGVRVSGGICYFLRSEVHDGATRVSTSRSGVVSGPFERELDEYDVFIRDIEAVDIVHRVREQAAPTVADLFSGGFGLDTNFADYTENVVHPDDLVLHLNVGGMGHKRATRYIPRSTVLRNRDIIDRWKVLVPAAAGYGAEQKYDRVLGKPIVAGPGEIGTHTYRVIGPFESEDAAHNFVSYYSTRFFRFLVSLRKVTQHASPSVYSWVPAQSWEYRWSDESLAEMYSISPEESNYIKTRIRDVDWAEPGSLNA